MPWVALCICWQWDVARPVFEASAAGQRYPVVHGVTHGVIRKAAGLWARQAVVQWHQRYPEAGHMLIGETPFVGHRFIELARQRADAAEPLLQMACFVVPVPSRAVRDFLEAERQRRSVRPLQHRNAKMLHHRSCVTSGAIWLALLQRSALAQLLPTSAAEVPYDPALYQAVYQRLLTQRQVLVLPMDTILPTTTLSVYDFAVPRRDVVPTMEEVTRFIGEVEQQYPDLDVLQQDIDRWYVTS